MTSQTFQCIAYREGLEGYASKPQVCQEPDATILGAAQTLPTLSQTTVSLEGHLDAGVSVSRTVQVDTDAGALFFLSWISDTVGFSLVSPSGQLIDPGYAASHPDEVSYSSVPGSAEFPPSATYAITNTQPGNWTLNFETLGSGSAGTDYLAFVAMESSRVLSFTTSAPLYQMGDIATFTATLDSTTGGISGATVTASLRRSDNVTDTVTFTNVSGGIYTVDYTIPNAPGSTVVILVAEGSDGGVPFTRQIDTLITVASPQIQLAGRYADRIEDVDGDGDGIYESLVFEADLTVTQATTVTISANLAKDGHLIAHTGVNTALSPGTQTVTLRFSGNDIHDSGLGGPYTVSDLIVVDLSKGAVPAVLASNVWTTAAYDPGQFGSTTSQLYLPMVKK